MKKNPMRLCYQEIANNPTRVVAMTGLKPDEFILLNQSAEQAWQRRMQRITLEGKPRHRGYKPRKSSVLPASEDRLLFVLSYLKLNALQEFHGAMFGIGQPRVCTWLGHLLPILEEALREHTALPERESSRLMAALAEHTTVAIDVTERPIGRSTDAETQREHYSGKKKDIPKSICW